MFWWKVPTARGIRRADNPPGGQSAGWTIRRVYAS